ncbi:LacI family DNA-binding transcriptional regulator [Jannaschia sp. W003]|uniref:LacI family DNA-binding transcriptional regulator n=1 Tax=Jannaschia sp. W003 TaxID=2867012 RepID=UPI0021A7F73C|nr:LacI family DNA-binding transcriptional regulator [Jannaschia sp. W003]UWQ22111.1 LacI family transcriptional regulator [Jannaschia sp. W003]
MTPEKVPNMETFARLSGVSRPTVSKYFHDPTSVRDSTRARIESALERYDFRPNVYAMNQNRRLTKIVGIAVPFLADPFFAELARNIEARVIEAGFSPLLFSAHGDPAIEAEIFDNLRSLKPAGVLLAPLGRTSDRDAVERFCREVPTVLFDANIEGLGATFVGSDNFQSVPLMVDYLCRTGSPPCFFEMPPVNPNARKRRTAYEEAMTRLGHEPRVVRVEGSGWGFEEIGYSGGLRAFEERRFETDTVLCSNDRLAIGLLAAAYEKGRRVGRGSGAALRVAGHDDHPFARFTTPSLTTVAQDYTAIAKRSVEALVEAVESGGAPGERAEVSYPGRLIMRASA